MTTKRCSYRNCGSYVSPSHSSPETLYAFPKDPERCKLWLKLGACREPIPYSMRYFCSKHFDETKYVSHNQRRKQLLSTAVPWPYQPSKDETLHEIDYQCAVSTIEDNEEDDEDSLEGLRDDEVSAEVSNEISNISETIEDALQSFEYSVADDFSITYPIEKRAKKRKMETASNKTDDLESVASNFNIISNRATSSTMITLGDVYTKEPKSTNDIDESKLLESGNLTTFIFKGQEYIQMPKDDYINEKITLIQKLKSYEEFFKNIKHLVDGVNL